MSISTSAAVFCFCFTLCLTHATASLPNDPDYGKNTSQLILSRGFQLETHEIETQDGYFLTTFRIIHPTNRNTSRPVILQHGLMFSSREWLIAEPSGHWNDSSSNRPGNSLAYELAKAGYDVWLPNSRGNSYSLKHRRFHKDSPNFWDFTLVEMAKFDVPAVIDYVLAKTGHQDLAYVGHSAGTMTTFGTLSLFPKYNQLLRPFVALAPVMSLGHTMTPLRVLAKTPFINRILGDGRTPFIPSNRLTQLVTYLMCRRPFQPLCTSMLGLAYGFNFEQLNRTRFDVMMSRLPAGTSTKNMMLFLQSVRTGRYTEFDYGSSSANMKAYNQPTPPEIRVEQVTCPNIVLFSSQNDYLASPQDVHILKTRLGVRPIIDHIVPHPKFNHLDFKLAKDVGHYVNEPVINILNRFNA